MPESIRRVDYFYATVHDRPGEAYRLLCHIARYEVSLLAFDAIPTGPDHTQVVLFPESTEQLIGAAERAGIVLSEPQQALLVQGSDRFGALIEVHRKLTDASVNVYASHGVVGGAGGYGYVIYVRPAEFETAAAALGV